MAPGAVRKAADAGQSLDDQTDCDTIVDGRGRGRKEKPAMNSLTTDRPPGGRLLAIGDIHGCLEPLQRLLAMVAPTTEDQLVFLGDYIDRGPESAAVVDHLLALRAEQPQTVFLRGNHEQMLLDFLAGDDPTMFLLNGGSRTLASYQVRGAWPLPAPHRAFFESLPLYYETERFIFVHAGLRPERPLADQTASDLLWIRQEFFGSDYAWDKTLVFGHTPLQQPLLTASRIGLDTGCVYGRQLTCCEVNSRTLWQA